MKQLPDATWEKTAKQLQSLMANRGFCYLPMSKFEEYDLYVENKSFLATEHIITFTDTTGKLLALKPDSTISIAKKIPAHPLSTFQKYYYRDDVLRFSKDNQEYTMLDQIGVEIMGPIDTFACIEIVDLALESLAIISEDSVLDISHNGFVHGLLEEAGLNHRSQKKCLAAIHSKSPHNLEMILLEEETPAAFCESILRLTTLSGSLAEVLPQAKKLIIGEQMTAAYEELEQLAISLGSSPRASSLFLDFSAVGDLEYYNGIVLVGYVKESPREVLTGGRYDKLLNRMKKQNGAIGFAISLSELQTKSTPPPDFDFDCLIFYTPTTDTAALLDTMQQLVAAGKSVRCEPITAQGIPLDYSYNTAYLFEQQLTPWEDSSC